MIRLLLSLALFLSTLLYADGTKEKTYIFKAKGEFAKELKALMEKHAKEGKVEIEEVSEKKRNFNQKEKSVLSSILGDDDLQGDLAYGKYIYEKTCHKCHGREASKSSYPTARVLNTLSKKEIYEALFAYRSDATYGKSARFIMREEISAMTEDEMISVSAYISSLSQSKTKDKETPNKTNPENNKEVPTQGTYLK